MHTGLVDERVSTRFAATAPITCNNISKLIITTKTRWNDSTPGKINGVNVYSYLRGLK